MDWNAPSKFARNMENNPTDNDQKKVESKNQGALKSIAAYALMSWLLATVTALIIMPYLYGGGAGSDETNARIVQIMMVGLCSFSGLVIGAVIGAILTPAREKDKVLPVVFAPFLGMIWGIIVGGVGGFPIFFIGGIILGLMFGVPFGFVSFLLFAAIYESLTARRPLRWWQIILIEIGVLGLSLAFGYLLTVTYAPSI